MGNPENLSRAAVPTKLSGKWVVVAMLLISLFFAVLWWLLVPRTNPRETDPGSPYYSPPRAGEH
jgi:hypothetical protein